MDRLRAIARWLRSSPAPEIAVVLLLAVAILRTAWVGDDAYITLRTVDNFLHGHGLTWNPGERVQAYTHPLWMLLLSASIAATGEYYVTTLVVSILVSVLAGAILVFALPGRRVSAVLGGLALMMSKAFVEYSTSGLENPLSNLLLAGWLWVFLRRELTIRSLAALMLLASLAVVNRLDLALLFAPGMVFALWRLRSGRAVAAVLVGALPIAAWLLFSFVYYGFPFPNTAYAKLQTGLTRGTLIAQGGHYLLASLRTDPGTLLLIGAGCSLAFWRRAPLGRGRLVAAGAVLYVAYVCWIGGDFMSGRFLATPFLASVAVAVRADVSWTRSRTLIAGAALLALAALVRPTPNLLSGPGFGQDRSGVMLGHGVADERLYYYRSTGLLRRDMGPPKNSWVAAGVEMRKEPGTVQVRDSVGFAGFYAGPDVHVVDIYALADPLLSHLPPRFNPAWRIGHWVRYLPAGYVETLRTGAIRLTDPGLAAYYEQVRAVTRGPVWSWDRLATAWHMNLGAFDPLIDRQRYRYPKRQTRELRPVEGRWIWSGTAPLRLEQEGITLELPEAVSIRDVDLALPAGAIGEIVLLRGDDEVWRGSPRRVDAAGAAIPTSRASPGGVPATRVWLIPRIDTPHPEPQPRIEVSLQSVSVTTSR